MGDVHDAQSIATIRKVWGRAEVGGEGSIEKSPGDSSWILWASQSRTIGVREEMGEDIVD